LIFLQFPSYLQYFTSFLPYVYYFSYAFLYPFPISPLHLCMSCETPQHATSQFHQTPSIKCLFN
jgi:hypothetical protein